MQGAVKKNAARPHLLWGPPHVPSRASILNLGFKSATFRIPSGSSAWDAHTGTAVVGSLCTVYWLKEYMTRTDTAGETLDDRTICGTTGTAAQNSLACSAIA